MWLEVPLLYGQSWKGCVWALMQDYEEGMRMIRTTHSRLFRASGGLPVITEAWGLDGWKGYVKGTSETSLQPDRSVRPRLQQCAHPTLPWPACPPNPDAPAACPHLVQSSRQPASAQDGAG